MNPPAPLPRTHRQATVNGVRLHYVEAGDPAGPLVLLLHGFPGFWYCWRHQIPALAAAGFRVVAPDLRGYGRSGKPARVSDYSMSHLVGDVLGLAGHLGPTRSTSPATTGAASSPSPPPPGTRRRSAASRC